MAGYTHEDLERYNKLAAMNVESQTKEESREKGFSDMLDAMQHLEAKVGALALLDTSFSMGELEKEFDQGRIADIVVEIDRMIGIAWQHIQKAKGE
jgi:hypothetical protein